MRVHETGARSDVELGGKRHACTTLLCKGGRSSGMCVSTLVPYRDGFTEKRS